MGIFRELGALLQTLEQSSGTLRYTRETFMVVVLSLSTQRSTLAFLYLEDHIHACEVLSASLHISPVTVLWHVDEVVEKYVHNFVDKSEKLRITC